MRTVARISMPKSLTGDAAALWKQIVPALVRAGRVTPLDVPALQDLCECWARLRACEARIDADGGMVTTSSRGDMVKHPLIPVARGYRESLQKYFQHFGLQPIDRARLEAGNAAAPLPVSAAEVLFHKATDTDAPKFDVRKALGGD